ncbi:MAG: GspH/FimT family pseudopilin [Terriglobia bacterium]
MRRSGQRDLPARRARQAGFSMLELVVVMIIFLILIAAAIPNVTQFVRAYRAEQAARQVVSDLQSGRMRALSENVRYRMRFPVPGNMYFLDRRNPATLVWEQQANFTLPPNAAFTAGVNPAFLPSGETRNPGLITILTQAGYTRSVIVSGGGSVRLTQ